MKTIKVITWYCTEYRVYPFQKPKEPVTVGKRDEYVLVRCAYDSASQRPEIELGSSDATQPTTLWGAGQMVLAWQRAIDIAGLLESYQETDVQTDEVWTGNTA